ncbi:MAG: hypothetical protein KDD47_24135 [Acidobacteria bacterium]|nr:hypothetical protein [Acidobacteriota bacterium]
MSTNQEALNMPSRYVFSVALIPVQEWISQARRSRDLRAGSVFLSFAMAQLLGQLEKMAGATILLPRSPLDQGTFEELAKQRFDQALSWDYSVPNRASGMLKAKDDEAVRSLFRSLQEHLQELWLDHRDGWLDQFRRCGGRSFEERLAPHLEAYRQDTLDGSDSPLDLVWAALPAKGSEEQSEDDLERIDQVFRNVKRSRPIRPWPHGRPVGKCNQCGCREAVGPTKSFDAWNRWHQEIRELPWIVKGVRLEKGERLCYVCLARRMAGYLGGREGRGVPFPSTAEVAASTWLQSLETVPTLAEPLAELRRLGLEEAEEARALYFRRRRPEADPLSDEQRQKLTRIWTTLGSRIGAYNRLQKEEGPEGRELPKGPSPYLALLTFDGDDMGQRVAEEPTALPCLMGTFAREARALFEHRGAKVFYLGGDEGLVMTAAASALPLALQVGALFREVFRDHPKLTLSAGLVYFDYERPLGGAIEEVHGAIRKAKGYPAKNALAVRVEAASGTTWEVRPRKWTEDWGWVGEAVRQVQEGELAVGWAHDAALFVRSLPAARWGESPVREAAEAEIHRLFLRRLTPKARRLDRDPWQRLAGAGSWSARELGSAPELFHLIAFLARQGFPQEAPTLRLPTDTEKGAA